MDRLKSQRLGRISHASSHNVNFYPPKCFWRLLALTATWVELSSTSHALRRKPFQPLAEDIAVWFSRILFGNEIISELYQWNSLPIKSGRIEIPSTLTIASLSNQSSACQSGHLINCLKGREPFDYTHYLKIIAETTEESAKMKVSNATLTLRKLWNKMDKIIMRKLDYLKEKGVGTCLSAMPSFSCETTLSTVEFSDELRDHHGLPLFNMP